MDFCTIIYYCEYKLYVYVFSTYISPEIFYVQFKFQRQTEWKDWFSVKIV
jgi:hypothetical protein